MNSVVLTVTDAIGYSSTCSTTVTVKDNLPPTVLVESAVVELNAYGMGTLFHLGSEWSWH